MSAARQPQDSAAPIRMPALSEIDQPCLDRAAKLQRALTRTLAMRGNPAWPASERERIGIEDYKREFGRTITGRALRALVKRTLDRDAGAGQLGRIELYLPDNPPRKADARPVISLAVETEFGALHSVITGFGNPAAPSSVEKRLLWVSAFELFRDKLAEGAAPKKLRRGLVKFLERNTPWLASSLAGSRAHALRVNFQRKYDQWIESGCTPAVADRRATNSGNWRAPELGEKDRDKLIAHAVFSCGGRVAQAWRELIERGELSEQVMGYYLSNPARKSYVPRRVVESVTYDVAMMKDIHHGPRQDKLNGAHISRDWSKVHAMDWLQGDDATMPVYFKAKGAKELMRGQLLPFIDLRSTRILGFAFVPERNYNARVIRTAITKICEKHGLPRKGFYFENGSWTAKILKGDTSTDCIPWAEQEQGLREFGLRFVHAKSPRAKPIERVIGALQNLMEGLPGYVGRDEQSEKFEREQKLIRLANKGDTKALAHFMGEDQWLDKFQELCDRYNADAQNGKMTCGLSPDEAFDQFRNLADPPIQFSPECRYLLANHKRPVKVTRNGITLPKSMGGFTYRNTETGRLRGQRVLVWIDPDAPEIVTVTDMRRKNAFCVERSQGVPAMDAPPDLLAQELDRIGQHQSYAKARYRVLGARYAGPVRHMTADPETIELGEQIGRERAALQSAQRGRERQESRARTVYGRMNMAVPQDGRRRPESVSAAEKLQSLLADDDEATEATI